jgi:hypothetical protein
MTSRICAHSDCVNQKERLYKVTAVQFLRRCRGRLSTTTLTPTFGVAIPPSFQVSLRAFSLRLRLNTTMQLRPTHRTPMTGKIHQRNSENLLSIHYDCRRIPVCPQRPIPTAGGRKLPLDQVHEYLVERRPAEYWKGKPVLWLARLLIVSCM